jgi:hypothetical protein
MKTILTLMLGLFGGCALWLFGDKTRCGNCAAKLDIGAVAECGRCGSHDDY